MPYFILSTVLFVPLNLFWFSLLEIKAVVLLQLKVPLLLAKCTEELLGTNLGDLN